MYFLFVCSLLVSYLNLEKPLIKKKLLVEKTEHLEGTFQKNILFTIFFWIRDSTIRMQPGIAASIDRLPTTVSQKVTGAAT